MTHFPTNAQENYIIAICDVAKLVMLNTVPVIPSDKMLIIDIINFVALLYRN